MCLDGSNLFNFIILLGGQGVTMLDMGLGGTVRELGLGWPGRDWEVGARLRFEIAWFPPSRAVLSQT